MDPTLVTGFSGDIESTFGRSFGPPDVACCVSNQARLLLRQRLSQGHKLSKTSQPHR